MTSPKKVRGSTLPMTSYDVLEAGKGLNVFFLTPCVFLNNNNSKNGLLLYCANRHRTKTTCDSTHNSHIDRPTHIQICTHRNMVHLDLWKGLLQPENFELSFEKGDCTGWQSAKGRQMEQ